MLQKTTLQKILPLGAVALALLVGIGFGWQARSPGPVADSTAPDDAANTRDTANTLGAGSTLYAANTLQEQSPSVVASSSNEPNAANQQDDASMLAKAESAYAAGDLETVVSILTPLAEAGNAVAQDRLGFMYSTGTGVDQNPDLAIEWYQKAFNNNNEASKESLTELLNKQLVSVAATDVSAQIPILEKLRVLGNSDANAVLGSYLLTGTGIEADPFRALPMLRTAAEQGDKRAMTNLGYAYAKGIGVSANERKSFEWYLQAGELGLVRAQVMVAAMLEQGIGTEQDIPESTRWYLNAASAGNEQALLRVGRLMLEGKVEAPNNEESAGIILRLAQHGDDDAVQWLEQQSKQSNVDAQSAYAHILLTDGSPHFDASAGLPLLMQAAEAGVSQAQLLLARQYASGEHIDLQPVRAYAWANLAAAEGSEGAITIRDAMLSLLTPAELAEGQTLSSELFEASKQ